MSDPSDPSDPSHVRVRYVGGPTVVLELGGVRLAVDPTFDPPGDYPIGARTLTKLAGPAFGPGELGAVDAVLLSHDQHPDNLDRLGREFALGAPLVLSTRAAHERLGAPVRSLPNWTHVDLPRPDGAVLRVTGVPAEHGPEGSLPFVGEVTGFVLSGDGLPSVYVSGDNASLDVVRAIVARLGTVDIAVLFAGAARTALMDGAPLTLTSDRAAEAARLLGARHIVPVHFEHWAHFSEGADRLVASFAAAGLAGLVHVPEPGEVLTF